MPNYRTACLLAQHAFQLAATGELGAAVKILEAASASLPYISPHVGRASLQRALADCAMAIGDEIRRLNTPMG